LQQQQQHQQTALRCVPHWPLACGRVQQAAVVLAVADLIK
jgi:hypothetical protein